MHLKNGIFSGPVTHLLSALCVLIKLLSHASVKRRKGFKFRTLLVILSSDIMAVKGLSTSAMTHKQLKGTLILMAHFLGRLLFFQETDICSTNFCLFVLPNNVLEKGVHHGICWCFVFFQQKGRSF